MSLLSEDHDRYLAVREVMWLSVMLANRFTEDSKWYSSVFDSWLRRYENIVTKDKKLRILTIAMLQKCQSSFICSTRQCSLYTEYLVSWQHKVLCMLWYWYNYLHYHNLAILNCYYVLLLHKFCQSTIVNNIEKNSTCSENFWTALVCIAIKTCNMQ